jgi:hypothetical protein
MRNYENNIVIYIEIWYNFLKMNIYTLLNTEVKIEVRTSRVGILRKMSSDDEC